MKIHQMLVQEIVRNLEFRKEFLTELEKFAEIAIEFHPEEIKEESIASAITFRTITRAEFESDTPAVIDVGAGYIRVRDDDFIIEGDEFLAASNSYWAKCVGLIGNTASDIRIIRRPYRPRYGWRMQEGWRELSEQELLQEGDEINSVSNAGDRQDGGWIYPSRENLGKLYSAFFNLVARRRIA